MHPDGVIARLAADQHGVISTAQLVAAGLSRRAIERRVESGHLIRLHQGVYVVGHRALPALAPFAAAVLATGPSALLSHRSAAHLWGILSVEEGAPIEISVTSGHPRSRNGIRVHRPTTLDSTEARRRDGLPVTSPSRTLQDLQSRLSLPALERAASEALAQRLVRELPAGPKLDALKGPRRTRSELERRFLKIVRDAGLPTPETNVRIATYEVDALWRDQRVVVELDSWQFHGHRLAFERDREKEQVLQAQGFTTRRVTDRQMDRPLQLAARLGIALGTHTPPR